jgi:hypothetical protein
LSLWRFWQWIGVALEWLWIDIAIVTPGFL